MIFVVFPPSFFLVLGLIHHIAAFSQQDVDYLANNLEIHYDVLDNLKETGNFTSRLILTNKGTKKMEYGPWSMFFNSIRMIEPNHLTDNPGGSTVLPKYKVMVAHVSGSLFKIKPLEDFKPIQPGDSLEILFHSQHFSVARTDVMPNFYIASSGLKPKNIKSTNESLEFVGAFDTKEKWKRYKSDLYNPLTPQQRFDKNTAKKDENIGVSILPSPLVMTVKSDGNINIKDWQIITAEIFQNEAEYLGKKLKLKVSNVSKDLSKTIQFIQENVDVDSNIQKNTYTLNVSNDRIILKALEASGAFYAVQSLLSILDKDQVPQVLIKDGPRYKYRGMMLDISRNFHGKDSILKIMDAMAMYKMNKLHLHMSDDEGWRLQIPGLKELTDFGGKRCHDTNMCITPQLGSGATMTNQGSGFLTIQQYKDILLYGKERHIEIIPEFDMPGHSHAAIKSMEHRYQKNIKPNNTTTSDQFQLTEPGDVSKYLSVQMFRDNAVNPCLDSTYNFVEHIITSLIEIHKDILPLKVFHIGGDEVANGAWLNSTACKQLISENPNVTSVKDLKKYFFSKVSSISAKYNLSLAAWEDGVMQDNKPFDLKDMSNINMFSYAWDNVWEWGVFNRAYILANAGYKNIMCHATHLYFDMPYEPDPEERGYYWATRYTDTRKTFGFMPDKLYDNARFRLNGEKTSREEICKKPGTCPVLTKPENIVGMQAHLWSETVRNEDELFYMIFPRMLAFAERSWHKAIFETKTNEEEQLSAIMEEWQEFANKLGQKELKRLDEIDIKYRIPKPGAKEMNGKLVSNVVFPGLKIEYRTEGDSEWRGYKENMKVDGKVTLRTKSTDNKRSSMEIVLDNIVGPTGSASLFSYNSLILLFLSFFGIYAIGI